MWVCQQQRSLLWESLRESLSVPPFNRAFMNFFTLTFWALCAHLVKTADDVMSEIECAQLHSELFRRRHSTRQLHGLFALAKHLLLYMMQPSSLWATACIMLKYSDSFHFSSLFLFLTKCHFIKIFIMLMLLANICIHLYFARSICNKKFVILLMNSEVSWVNDAHKWWIVIECCWLNGTYVDRER